MLEKYCGHKIVVYSILVAFLMLCPIGALAGHVVVIDPAHGGNDLGVMSGKTAEKDLTLAVALELKKALDKQAGINVVLTRDTDKTLSIQERQKKILEAKPALVLSLHINAGFGKNSSGFELYYTGFTFDSAGDTKSKKGGAAAKKKHLNDTVKLARIVQRSLDNLFVRKGRGLREAPVPLAEGLSVPVLVVELGFITNADDKKKLVSPKMQKDIAGALASAIKSFF